MCQQLCKSCTLCIDGCSSSGSGSWRQQPAAGSSSCSSSSSSSSNTDCCATLSKVPHAYLTCFKHSAKLTLRRSRSKAHTYHKDNAQQTISIPLPISALLLLFAACRQFTCLTRDPLAEQAHGNIILHIAAATVHALRGWLCQGTDASTASAKPLSY
jgi:hypothetical protein